MRKEIEFEVAGDVFQDWEIIEDVNGNGFECLKDFNMIEGTVVMVEFCTEEEYRDFRYYTEKGTGLVVDKERYESLRESGKFEKEPYNVVDDVLVVTEVSEKGTYKEHRESEGVFEQEDIKELVRLGEAFHSKI